MIEKFIQSILITFAFCHFLFLLDIAPKPLVSYAANIVWDYKGAANPENWGQFSSICSTGQNQSPIDINTVDFKDLSNISFHYQPKPLRILNNKRTVQANSDISDFNNYMTIDEKSYILKQFHYHSPSEHSINGQTFPAELHLVHKADDKYAVVGIFLTEGKAENLFYKPFIDRLPLQETPEADIHLTINTAKLLPNNQTTYRYQGSLTTPPCTEEVSWLLMTTPVELSTEQIQVLKQAFNGNNRPLQSRGKREIIQDITS